MNTNKYKKIVISILIIALATLYGFVPSYNTAIATDALTDASDTISDSDPGEVAHHTVTFTTGTTTPQNGWIDVVWHNDFGDVAAASSSCPDTNWATTSPDTETIRCTASSNRPAGTYTIISNNITNPNPSTPTSYTVTINSYDAGGYLQERAEVRVAIIDDVLMTARVESTLDFSISGLGSVDTGVSVNGIDCTATTTATTTPFGTLAVMATSTVCQQLSVTTNANEGFIVTVEQDHELLSDSGANINSINNGQTGAGSTTPMVWPGPLNQLDHYNTYGHMGLTSNDDDADDDVIMTNDYYVGSTAYYVGLNGTNPTPVMAHNGPADGTTQNFGQAEVAFSAQIASLQEAGDYSSTLTYICTPTY
jgi:hypothetical protein